MLLLKYKDFERILIFSRRSHANFGKQGVSLASGYDSNDSHEADNEGY